MTFKTRRLLAVGCVALGTAAFLLRDTLIPQSPPVAPSYREQPVGTLTFSESIAPIIFDRCSKCHRPGESAPFSLLTYMDCRNHASQIADVVTRRLMPPWLPDPTVVEFADQRVLTIDEIGMIRQWAEEGAAEGDPTLLPKIPEWTTGWQLGEPDLIVDMPEPYELLAEGLDVYRNFVIPIELPSTKFVRAVEIRPGNARIVHHGVLLIDATRESRKLDNDDPKPGFGGMVYGLTARSPDGHFLGWTPGKGPWVAPDGMAWRLEPESDLVLQLHMLPSGKPEQIQSAIGLYFTDTPPIRRPFMLRIGSRTIDIPAGEKNYRIHDAFELPVDVDILGVYPHAHYLAHELNGQVDLPDGSQEWLIRIPQWDFNWQDEYRYPVPLAIPKGARLRMDYSYDNSADNIRNPHSPPRRVVWGPSSADEMGDLWIQVLPHDPLEGPILAEAFAKKEFEAYLAGYRHDVSVNPDDVAARYNLACLLEQIPKFDEAEEHYNMALQIDPTHTATLNNLGVLHCKQGRYPEAIPLFETALALRPDYADARVNLQRARRYLKKPE